MVASSSSRKVCAERQEIKHDKIAQILTISPRSPQVPLFSLMVLSLLVDAHAGAVPALPYVSLMKVGKGVKAILFWLTGTTLPSTGRPRRSQRNWTTYCVTGPKAGP